MLAKKVNWLPKLHTIILHIQTNFFHSAVTIILLAEDLILLVYLTFDIMNEGLHPIHL